MTDSKPHKEGFDIDVLDLSELMEKAKKGETEKKEEPPPKESAPVTETIEAGPPPKTGEKKEATIEKPAGSNIKRKHLSEEQKGKIIDLIFAKMKKKGNFPSFTQQIASVNKILKLKYASAKDIADVIGRDFALSQKLLRLVNSSFYGQFSKKGLSTITEAMIILGADCIQQMAASLMLFEMMQSSSQTDQLKDMTIGNFVSGIIAKDIAQVKGFNDTESFLICSMFNSIGEYMIIFYFPDEFEKVNELMRQNSIDKDIASSNILGVTYQELGVGIASKWNLPEYILMSMAPIAKNNISKKPTNQDMLQYVSSFSNEICEVAMLPDDTPNPKSLEDVMGEYQEMIDITSEEIEGVLDSVSEQIQEHATNLKIDVNKSRLLQKISGQSGKKEFIDPSAPEPAPKKKKAEKKVPIHEKIKQIKLLLKRDYNIGDILTKVLDIMYNDFNYKRVGIGIKAIDGNEIAIRFVLGEDIESFKTNFLFKIKKSEDVFNIALRDNTDIIVHDVESPEAADIVPKWFKEMGCTNGFAVYPMIVDGIPFGIFYADSDSTKQNDYVKFHGDMKRLRTLAVKAIRMKSG